MDTRVLDEAAEWLVRLHDSQATLQDRQAFECWRQAHPSHAQAWQRAEVLMGKLGGLPPALAMPALDRPRVHRRAAVAKLAALLAAVPTGWLAWRLADGLAEHQGWGADLRTATGERRQVRLADGSALLLDTASAVDIKFDSAWRLIHLRQGAIWLQTASDSAHRPLVVDTAQGRLRALGTRFAVRQDGPYGDGGAVRLAVEEGAVEVTLRGAAQPALVVPAGQQVLLQGRTAGPLQPAAPEALAWTHGMLMADATPLAQVCAELGRYRSGLLHCAPEVAGLRVSGAFPLQDTDRALAMLAATYPVAVVQRLGGLWVSLVAPTD